MEFFAAAKVSSSFPPPSLPEIAFAGKVLSHLCLMSLCHFVYLVYVNYIMALFHLFGKRFIFDHF